MMYFGTNILLHFVPHVFYGIEIRRLRGGGVSTSHKCCCDTHSMFGVIILHEAVMIWVNFLDKRDQAVLYNLINIIRSVAPPIKIPAQISTACRVFWLLLIRGCMAILLEALSTCLSDFYSRLICKDCILKLLIIPYLFIAPIFSFNFVNILSAPPPVDIIFNQTLNASVRWAVCLRSLSSMRW